MRFGNISISEGNLKIGATPSFSVSPVITCRADAPCLKDCYACKMCKRYPNVKTAYERNTLAVEQDPQRVFDLIWAYLVQSGTSRFRWNVAGDMFSYAYMDLILEMAKAMPTVQFLVYSKQYELVNDALDKVRKPDNLTIVLSAWDSFIPENPHNLPMAWYQDGHCNVPDNSFTCAGKCGACGFKCWNLKRGENVTFNKH